MGKAKYINIVKQSQEETKLDRYLFVFLSALN